jgi:23S rRNA pseudouridine1911/1915/1917 synthase
MQIITFSIDNSKDVNVRIDKILFEKTSQQSAISRNKIKDLILENQLKKNGETLINPAYKVKLNDRFEFNSSSQQLAIEPQNIPLNIIYEDKDMLVINKQAGLISHICEGKFKDTLVNALLYHYGKKGLSDIGGATRPGIVHRLDKDTTGLMVIAKNNKSHKSLAEQIKTNTLKRSYLTLVWGRPIPTKGVIQGYINRSKKNRLKRELYQNQEQGSFSLTEYEVKETYANDLISLVECHLNTGKTHQIRTHFSNKKHPLIGDKLYGGHSRKAPKNLNMDDKTKKFLENFPRQALHAYKISFLQPTTQKEKTFEIDFPEDMKTLTDNLKKNNKS